MPSTEVCLYPGCALARFNCTLNGHWLTHYWKKVAKFSTKLSQEAFPQLFWQQNTTATGSFSKSAKTQVERQLLRFPARIVGMEHWPAFRPLELLKIIHCNCTTDCSTTRCSCQKHGMKCSLACSHCHGSGCANASPLITQDEYEDEIE